MDEGGIDNEFGGLTESHVIRFLVLEIGTTADYKIEKCPKLACGSITMEESSWVTKDNIIDAFMDCRVVELGWSSFKDEKVREIMKGWVQGSLIEELTFSSSFSHSKILLGVFANFNGAVPLKKAQHDLFLERRKRLFRNGQGYRICQENGTEAIVYVWNGRVVLMTDFQLEDDGKDMDVRWKYDRYGPDVEEL